MSKLTKTIREDMAKKLVNHRYTDEAKGIVAEAKVLFEDTYNHIYTKPVLDAMHVVDSHFPGTFNAGTQISVNANGWSAYISPTFHSRWVAIPQEKHPGKLMNENRYRSNNVITDEALVKRIQEHMRRRENFDDVCKTAYHEALSVLNTMTTGKKLAEAWPEAMAVIGDLIPEDQRTLPVVQVSAINAKFKLPPEEAAK